MTTANTTIVEATNAIPEIWDMEVQKARYYYGNVMSRVSNKSGLVKEKGDKINVTIDSKLSGGTPDADGTFTVSTRTPGTVQLSVDTWKYAVVEVTDQASAQSFWTPESTFPFDAGRVFATYQDTDLLALYASFAAGATGSLGAEIYSDGAPKAFGSDAASEALLLFADNDKPMEDIFFVVPPSAIFRGIAKEPALTDVNRSGAGGKTPLITGDFKMPLVGAPIIMSNLVAKTGNGAVRKALLLHKSAMAIAMQYNNKYRKYDAAGAGRLAEGMVSETLYGVKVIRADHGMVINTI